MISKGGVVSRTHERAGRCTGRDTNAHSSGPGVVGTWAGQRVDRPGVDPVHMWTLLGG